MPFRLPKGTVSLPRIPEESKMTPRTRKVYLGLSSRSGSPESEVHLTLVLRLSPTPAGPFATKLP